MQMLQHKHTLAHRNQKQKDMSMLIPLSARSKLIGDIKSQKLTFLAPIQKLYQSLCLLSCSKKHSSMSEQSFPANPERLYLLVNHIQQDKVVYIQIIQSHWEVLPQWQWQLMKRTSTKDWEYYFDIKIEKGKQQTSTVKHLKHTKCHYIRKVKPKELPS